MAALGFRQKWCHTDLRYPIWGQEHLALQRAEKRNCWQKMCFTPSRNPSMASVHQDQDKELTTHLCFWREGTWHRKHLKNTSMGITHFTCVYQVQLYGIILFKNSFPIYISLQMPYNAIKEKGCGQKAFKFLNFDVWCKSYTVSTCNSFSHRDALTNYRQSSTPSLNGTVATKSFA